MSDILESVGDLTCPLDEEQSVNFSLKVAVAYLTYAAQVLATSVGSMFRLRFLVKYKLKDGTEHREDILSQPFVVCSNRKKQLKGILFAIVGFTASQN